MAGPTVVAHGADEQRKGFLLDMVSGDEGWWQFFSEPGAGSDRAGLQTKAVRDGEQVGVQRPGGVDYSSCGNLIARTNPDVPRHKGITYLVIDVEPGGVVVGALKEMTGEAMFNEMFFNDARMLPGCPNLFVLMGPHSPIGNFSLIAVAEVQADYVMG